MKFYEFHGKRNICGDRIREARQKKRLSQSDLSKMLQLAGVMVERDTISRMESGDRFVADFETVIIADVLEVPVLWLLGREKAGVEDKPRRPFSLQWRGAGMNYKGYKQLQWEQRLQIEGALKTGGKVADIAAALGVCKKTIYNEIKRGLCAQQTSGYEFVKRYCADVAERRYQENLRAKGPEIKLGTDFEFVEYIEDQIINKRRSPGAALAQIEIDGKEFDTEICETTLYNWIYGGVFLNLTERDLLYKGERRNEGKRERDTEGWARPPKGETIEHRPEEINSRETFGNWEMDSIVGCKGSKAALVVLTERMTRYPVIIWVPDHTMESVVRALDRMERRMGAKFREVFQSITVDNGCEFQDCAGMERSRRARKPRTKIFYCHPYSAYERGSNENMNRIIRRWFPKGTNFDNVAAAEVAVVEEWLANYPRRILGWKTPQILFDEYMTVAA